MELTKEQVAELQSKSEKYDKMKESSKKSYKRRNARITLMLDKARKAKIGVSDAEVDAYLKMIKK